MDKRDRGTAGTTSDPVSTTNARAEEQAPAVWVETKDLAPWSRNPRQNDENARRVARLIVRFGFGAPLVARAKDREVIAGHTRLKAVALLPELWRGASAPERARWSADARRLLERPQVPVRFMELSEFDAHLLALADNRANELSPWDMPELYDILADYEADDAELAGWSAEELGKIAESLFDDDKPGDELGDSGDADDPPPPAPTGPAITQLGDVWELGAHRLVCGNSTSLEIVRRLLAGDDVPCVFTDPPYNVAGENELVSASVRKRQADLKAAAWDRDFDVRPTLAVLDAVIGRNASVYVCTSHHLAGDVWAWAKGWADHHSWCSWAKPNPMPSLSKRHWTWNGELVCYATRGKHTFNFPETGHALSTWTIPRAKAATAHPTEKPVAVPAHAIRHSSKGGDVVLDLFGGSGSTLLACEQLSRRARLVELDPIWCDAIVARWEKHTGKAARRL